MDRLRQDFECDLTNAVAMKLKVFGPCIKRVQSTLGTRNLIKFYKIWISHCKMRSRCKWELAKNAPTMGRNSLKERLRLVSLHQIAGILSGLGLCPWFLKDEGSPGMGRFVRGI